MSKRRKAVRADGSRANGAERTTAAIPPRGQRTSARTRRRQASRQRGRRSRWTGAAAMAVIAVALVAAWLILHGRGTTALGPDGLPGPLGGSSIAQDINTLVGQPAPGFTLSDAEGVRHTVTPGQGRPIVLVFHMGIT